MMLLLKLKVLLLMVFLVVEPTCGREKDLTTHSLLKRLHFSSTSSYSNCIYNLPEQNHSCSSSADCPTWFVCNDTNSGRCQCGPGFRGAIKCNEKKMISAVLSCYCVTETNGETYAGLCYYNCERPFHLQDFRNIYPEITNKRSLNEFMCGHFKRTGILCGECEKGLSPFVLSYNLSCVECSDGHKNWWKFVLVGFVPLTFFYFFVVFFNINVTSSRLHGYIIFSQALSTPACVRILFLAVEGNPLLLKAIKLIQPFYSLWNLDPFRSVFPDICLNIDTLQAFALDACIAVYPLVLILLSYFLIELYDRNVWCIVFIWKPFRLMFRLFHEHWDIRTSVIDSFASFILLSYVKILSVSMDLMLFTPVHELHSNKHHYRLYYAANIKFFTNYHIPYALLSTALLIFLIAIPTLILILYPCRCFQWCLSHYQIRYPILHTFVDSFQGCYKDGTEPDTHDLRWFSAYGFLLRFGICITFVLTLSTMYFIYALLVILLVIILLINFQPYKTSVAHYTTIDVSFLILLSLFYESVLGINISYGRRHLYSFCILAFVSSVIPIIYIAFIALHWIYSRRKWGGMLLMRVRALLM